MVETLTKRRKEGKHDRRQPEGAHAPLQAAIP